MEREAIGRNDVEACARKQHDPSRLRFGVPGLKRLEDRDLAGDIEIGNARAEAGAGQRLGGIFERPRAVENRRCALQRLYDRVGAAKTEGAALGAELGRDPVEFGRIAAGEDGREAGDDGCPGDMPADESGRAVNEQFRRHLESSPCRKAAGEGRAADDSRWRTTLTTFFVKTFVKIGNLAID